MVLCTLLFGCKDKPGPGPEPEPTPTPWEESFNGQLVLALSGAYDTWETDNTLAATVKWEGLNVHVSEYARAAIVLTLKMVDEPETWMDDDVVYPSATFALTSGHDTCRSCDMSGSHNTLHEWNMQHVACVGCKTCDTRGLYNT